ncbi:Assimilatory nitrate reductase large subunit [Rubellimicrobium mesophilum DSM 19309]|uniref:Assimilatory nitrate reductase large subunit n=1 Tax=Rubellimicrobium mesophilum DSM 19309 TaxID=442562 RepID=A0A017HTJ0_9RHOB|nr:nitrate reductase [Rubellimicrobium mesophilum]EYD77711.1 Assimilatory nitrate reductase large subunit [Rubellimicrobium mesophilum DSM 19309]
MPATRDSVADIWGPRTPHGPEAEWPVRVDEQIDEPPERWVQAGCVLCSNGCGLDIGVKDNRIVGVRGREEDVVNKGRLGPKGLHGWQANMSGDRLTHPLIRRNGRLEQASWDEAMDLIVTQTRDLCDRYTSGAIGFYTTGQLFLEEYYTLALIEKAGLGTPHMDGNTRLCTATAAAALKETFGADGQPGSYEDIDVTDCILHFGHNIAATDTVLWMRVLDRRAGPNPPKLIVVDPRLTATAREADVHLAPRAGTNMAVLNGLQHLLIQGGYVDRSFVEAHTLGYAELERTVRAYSPQRVEEITGVPAADLRRAAEMIGTSEGLVSTVLQGVYQSNQATASACQVNNINLILGRIGRPGCGILQMNGQPTAQNTRETGADGDLPGFRNWANKDHVQELADLWNVDVDVIPHWAPPTHALEMFHLCQTGSIRMLWIQATNPAVSLPDLGRIRKILQKRDLFVIVQDAFMTETAQLADVVLPAAIWGEKTGCSTNVSRVVHLHHKAIDPPGEARSGLDIFLDYARRMDFRDKDGAPLIKWSDPEEAFEAWKDCTRGRPCDYTGLSYAKLTGGSGIPWPCNEEHPDGSVRMYTDLHFATDPDYCESFGQDLDTGAPKGEEKFRALAPNGRALLRSTDYIPQQEQVDEEYPFLLTTGRLVFHFHTRTKTARAPTLNAAAPDDFIQVSEEDAARLGIRDGEWLKLTSRRGALEAPARVGDIEPGMIFIPFHFGYWDNPGRARAANEMTLYDWDPISKQPHFKHAAVKLEKVEAPTTRQPEPVDLHPDEAPAPGRLAATVETVSQAVANAAGAVASTVSPPRAHLADYIGLLLESEELLARVFEQTAETHVNTPDMPSECALMAAWSHEGMKSLQPFVAKYGERQEGETERLEKALMVQRTSKNFDLLRDLHDLFLLANESLVSAAILEQAATALRDDDLRDAVTRIREHNERQREWLFGRCRQAAPQTLVVPS